MLQLAAGSRQRPRSLVCPIRERVVSPIASMDQRFNSISPVGGPDPEEGTGTETSTPLWARRSRIQRLYYRRFPQIAATGIGLNLSIIRTLLCRKMHHKPLVHVIGDSHVRIFRSHKPFLTYRIGPSTAYKLASEHSMFNSRQRLFRVVRWAVRPGEPVLIVFGEIDCRIHIYNAYMRGGKERAVAEVTHDTIERYGKTLKILKGMGMNVFVYSVPPAGKSKLAENIFGYQFYAKPDTRSAINRGFNAALREYCVLHGLKFIDVYSRVVNPEGFIADEYNAGDDVHLNEKAVSFVREYLESEI